ncbi:hypothetical protein TRIUR3_09529 [Triticum urartu]|uniref:Uncharacterized protein n=1 Tax=Triticum urartu TaxID=4572 RepID=M7ZHS9_TRIUA|nr:hypothetical protein TRIUR3_09529 [Triticum urartu]
MEALVAGPSPLASRASHRLLPPRLSPSATALTSSCSSRGEEKTVTERWLRWRWRPRPRLFLLLAFPSLTRKSTDGRDGQEGFPARRCRHGSCREEEWEEIGRMRKETSKRKRKSCSPYGLAINRSTGKIPERFWYPQIFLPHDERSARICAAGRALVIGNMGPRSNQRACTEMVTLFGPLVLIHDLGLIHDVDRFKVAAAKSYVCTMIIEEAYEINLKKISKSPSSARLRTTRGAPVNLLNVCIVCLSVKCPLFSRQNQNSAISGLASREKHELKTEILQIYLLSFRRQEANLMHEGVDLAIEVVSPAEEEQRWGGSYREVDAIKIMPKAMLIPVLSEMGLLDAKYEHCRLWRAAEGR